MSRLKILIFLIIPLLIGCRDIKLSDDDVFVSNRYPSPNGEYIIFKFIIDDGPSHFGVVKATDTLDVMENTLFSLHSSTGARYEFNKWLDNTTIELQLDERPFMQQNVPIDTNSIHLGEIKAKVVANNPNKALTPIIEHYAFSPNRSNLLVAYHYENPVDLNISIISLGSKLPVVGNITATGPWDTGVRPRILFARWISDEEINISVNAEEIKYFSLQDIKKTKFKTNIISERPLANSSAEPGWYNKPLFSSDQMRSMAINKYLTNSHAIIRYVTTWGDSYDQKLENYIYEYSVNEQAYKSYFRAKKGKFKENDKIEIVYYKRQPIIHLIKKNYSR